MPPWVREKLDIKHASRSNSCPCYTHNMKTFVALIVLLCIAASVQAQLQEICLEIATEDHLTLERLFDLHDAHNLFLNQK